MIEATVETFDDLVREGEVLVDIWGPQCQPGQGDFIFAVHPMAFAFVNLHEMRIAFRIVLLQLAQPVAVFLRDFVPVVRRIVSAHLQGKGQVAQR